ncbi:hypothetical protein TWF718_008986 [Orbilia javanica]|uniref:Uncharacterized protein n=1 Tax=Orbilia javanica TaxID=47235 RepID=A0AAN8RG32_9PEZI
MYISYALSVNLLSVKMNQQGGRGNHPRGNHSRGNSSRGNSSWGNSSRGNSSRGSHSQSNSRGNYQNQNQNQNQPQTQTRPPGSNEAPTKNVIYLPDVPGRPNSNAATVEGKMEQQSQKFQPSIHTSDFPPRRGFGTLGRNVLVRANYFPLKLKSGQKYYRYEITLTPEEEKRSVRHRLIELFIEEGLREFVGEIATDGTSCYAARELPLEKHGLSENKKFLVKLWWRDDVPAAPGPRSKEYHVQIRANGSFSVSDLTENYIMGESRHRDPGHENDDDTSKSLIQILNIVLNQGPGTDAHTASDGKNKFFRYLPNQAASEPLGYGLKAIKGFYKSVRPSFGQVLCNINVVTSSFYDELDLIKAIESFLKRKINNEPLRDWERKKISSFLRHAKVTLRHLNGKPWVIGNVSHQNADESTFTCTEYGQISVRQYFQKKYKVGLQNPRLQLFQSGNTMVPIELCSISPGQFFRGKLQDAQTASMMNFACRRPKENADMIAGAGLKTLKLDNVNGGIPDNFGITVDQNMIIVPARILPTPKLQYLNKAMNVPTGRGQWNLSDVRFYRGAALSRLQVLSFSGCSYRNYTPGNISKLVSGFREACVQVGIQHDKDDPSRVRHDTIDAHSLIADVESVFLNIKKLGPEIVLIILPKDLAHWFQKIKYLGDVKVGIATVVVVFETAQRKDPNPAYWANVLLKVNQRLGGVNHVLQEGDLKGLRVGGAPVMLVGMDVTHPSPSSARGAPSMAAVVASCDGNFLNYPASLRIQERGEMITELRQMFRERLALYRRNLKCVPKAIIIYRDGVSEGQYLHVLTQEFRDIVKACDDFEPKYRPRITLIVVGKRHHTRFYPAELGASDGTGNCFPGTVVDRSITDVYNFDFFLQTHKAAIGTARPAHYFVLRCENSYTANDLQKMVRAPPSDTRYANLELRD